MGKWAYQEELNNTFFLKPFCFAKAFTKLLRKVLSKTLRKNSLRRKLVLKEKIKNER
uniref:Uncharacterized protein n=1 Tax=Candidatus Methanophaga sp. ANME-1 ERB7 TaxID=2759913 RepID=A0A7G9ZAH8_9EURY|nr:hypothetical protein HCLJFGEB_00006 [Methanosarcinales archaeon ANME-1 ERB7]